jgi:hypothetical protein
MDHRCTSLRPTPKEAACLLLERPSPGSRALRSTRTLRRQSSMAQRAWPAFQPTQLNLGASREAIENLTFTNVYSVAAAQRAVAPAIDWATAAAGLAPATCLQYFRWQAVDDVQALANPRARFGTRVPRHDRASSPRSRAGRWRVRSRPASSACCCRKGRARRRRLNRPMASTQHGLGGTTDRSTRSGSNGDGYCAVCVYSEHGTASRLRT